MEFDFLINTGAIVDMEMMVIIGVASIMIMSQAGVLYQILADKELYQVVVAGRARQMPVYIIEMEDSSECSMDLLSLSPSDI